MSLSIQKINRFSPYFAEVKALYEQEFPKEERYPLTFLWLMAMLRNVDFWAVLDGQKVVGFCYLINDGNVTFILYMAVNSRLQGKGYGSKILELIHQLKAGNVIVLDIETLDDAAVENFESRQKRQHFYQKNGYQKLNFQVKDIEGVFDVWAKNGEISAQTYQNLIKKWSFGRYSVDVLANK